MDFAIQGRILITLEGQTWPGDRLGALCASREKWQTLVVYLETNDDVPYDGSTQTCACCHAFLRWTLDASDHCRLCPIRQATGHALCHGTPYTAYYRAGVQYSRAKEKTARARKGAHDRALKAAREQVQFLNRLIARERAKR